MEIAERLDRLAEETRFLSSVALAMSCQFDSEEEAKLHCSDNAAILNGMINHLTSISDDLAEISLKVYKGS